MDARRKVPWDASTLLLWLVVLAFAVPALQVGYVNDDWFQLLSLRDPSTALHLYEFIPQTATPELMDQGFVPWFTTPELKVVFLRPLAGLSLAVDSWLFGHRALPAHVHSLLWFIAVVELVRRLHLRLLPLPAARLATFMFALASAHADALTWLAARHALLGAAFGLGALLLHVSSQKLTLWRALAGVALLGAGLLCSETALGAVAYVLCFEWWGRKGNALERLERSALVLLTTSAYLVYYALAGYGVAHAGGYVSPFQDPIGFGQAVVLRLPALLAELWSGVPSLLYNFDDAARMPLIVLGVLASLVVGVALAGRRGASQEGADAVGSGSLSWVWVGALLSLVPVSGSVISGRVLLLPLLGSTCALALLASPRPGAVGGGKAFGGRALRWTVFGLHLGFSPLLRLGLISQFAAVARAQNEIIPRADLRCAAGTQTLLVNGSDPSLGMYLPALLALTPAERGEPSGRGPIQLGPVRALSMASSPLSLTRTGENELTVTTQGPRMSHFIERLYRKPEDALRPGDAVQLRGFSARVIEVAAAGPTKVAFTTEVSLDASEVCLLRWVGAEGGGRLESFQMRGGETILVPFVPGPMGL